MKDWFEVISTNLNSVYYGVMAVMPHMIEQKFGAHHQHQAPSSARRGISARRIIPQQGWDHCVHQDGRDRACQIQHHGKLTGAGFTLTDMLAKVPENVQEQINRASPWVVSACPRR